MRRAALAFMLLSACGKSEAPAREPAAVEVVPPAPDAQANEEPPVPAPETPELPLVGTLSCPSHCEGVVDERNLAAFARQVANVRRCYDRTLRQDPNERGRMVVELVVLEDGQVCSVSKVESDLRSPDLESCVLSFFQGIEIRPTEGCVVIRQPLAFKPADAGAGP